MPKTADGVCEMPNAAQKGCVTCQMLLRRGVCNAKCCSEGVCDVPHVAW